MTTNHHASEPCNILNAHGYRAVQIAYWLGLQQRIRELEDTVDGMDAADEYRADAEAELAQVQALADTVREHARAAYGDLE